MKLSMSIFLAAASISLTTMTFAHHSRTMFDDSIDQVLHGSIVKFNFINPHAFIIMAVENEDGTTTNWQLEGGNAMGLIRRGWRPDSLRSGDVVELTINPLRSGAPGGEWHLDQILLFDKGSDTGIAPLER